MQACNFGGTFDQLSFEFSYEIFTEDASQLFLYHGAKKSKMTKNSNQRGGEGEGGGGGSCLNAFSMSRKTITTTEEEQSSLKRLEETIPELFQCAVVRQMGIDLFIEKTMFIKCSF